MCPVTSALRDLLAQAEAGEIAGVAWTANFKGGPVRSGFVGDLGGRIAQLVNLQTGDRSEIRMGAAG